jgi:predicted ATPase
VKRRDIRPGALPVRRVEGDPDADLASDQWPATTPAIAQLLREGLDLGSVTVLIGENGSGKSTMIEGVAGAYGLSPEGGCLGLVGLLHELAQTGTSQVLVATHSPVVASIPGARLLQFDDQGFHESSWQDLELVQHYRSFLAEPMRYLRHLL